MFRDWCILFCTASSGSPTPDLVLNIFDPDFLMAELVSAADQIVLALHELIMAFATAVELSNA